jgi:hypothetical protein
MWHRARKLTDRLRSSIPQGGRVADIGSGTGHNAAVWRQDLNAQVDEFDVADMHWIGQGPRLFDGLDLPADDDEYSVAVLLFVLHYAVDPVKLLTEASRVSSSHVIVIQSTYHGPWGRVWLNLREWIWGPLAFAVARCCGVIRGLSCPLKSQTLYSRQELAHLFQQAGLTIQHQEPSEWWGLRISRDLYLLQANLRLPETPPATSQSSFRPEMKNSG